MAPFRLDRVLTALRGVKRSAHLTKPGDTSESSFEGKLLNGFLETAAAATWHERFCNEIGPAELQRKDKMCARCS
jgi:hypothetical protein